MKTIFTGCTMQMISFIGKSVEGGVKRGANRASHLQHASTTIIQDCSVP